MTTLEKAEQLLAEMTPAEKVQLLHWITCDLSGSIPGIERTPDIAGGEPRISGTRIPVWTLVQYKKLGANEAEILEAFPTLEAQDLVNAWSYFRLHKSEIEQQIIENESA